MILNRKFLSLLLCTTFILKTGTSQTMPTILRVPLAAIEGAAATACLLTAATCLRSCLDTKLKSMSLKADSWSFGTQRTFKAQIAFIAKAMLNDVIQTGCRTAEMLALKTAMLGATTVTGLGGLYLAYCSLRTLTR